MTNTRLAALEAVAEAVRVWSRTRNGTEQNHDAVLRILARLATLDAPPAQPPGKTVDVQAHVRLSNDGGAYIVSGMGALNGNWTEPRPGGAFATLTARVPLPAVPSVTANVEVTP